MNRFGHILFFLALFLGDLLPAQSPLPTDSICSIPVYTGSFYTVGPSEGQFAPDFTLYDSSGQGFHLASELQQGKPILVVNGSLTCPVFRDKIPLINQIQSMYGSVLTTIVVLTVEAHPTTISPYFGMVNITGQNQQAGILYPQPQTYGERLQLASILQNQFPLNVPVLLDLPCNMWWNTYGPAPNNAYLIQSDGRIFRKHGWFNRNPDRIFCDIDSLVGTPSGNCQPLQGPGVFQAQLLNGYSFGLPGTTLFNYVDLINPGATPVEVLIMTLEEYLPDTSWSTSYCADICYLPGIDSISLTLSPYDTLPFSLDYFTGPQPGLGRSKIGFRNQMNTQNKFSFWLEASTLPSSLESLHQPIQHLVLPKGSSWPLLPDEHILAWMNILGQSLPVGAVLPYSVGSYLLHTNVRTVRLMIVEK
jgi:hypothetical protein